MFKRFKLHDAVLVLHRSTGLTIAVFLAIVGLTGTVLAFGTQIDRLLNPELHAENPSHRAPLGLAELAERAEAAYPHLRVYYFFIAEDQAVMMVGARQDPATGKPYTDIAFNQLILDPFTGSVLGPGKMENDWHGSGPWRMKVLPFAYSLHTSLATNTNTGWTIVGIVALAWTIDCLVAFWLTLPRGAGPFWKRWGQAWKVKWAASSTRVHFDLHRAGGLWLWPLLFIFGWSSVMLGLTQVYEPVMKTLFPFTTIEESIARLSLPKAVEHPALSWRQAQQAGEREMAALAAARGFTVERPYGMAYIDMYGAYTYCVRSSIDFRGDGWDTSVLIDGNTGKLRSVDLPRGQHLGNTISTLLWGIHYGDLRGWLPYRIAIGLFGLFLAMLSYTGVAIWWNKRRARRLVRLRQS